MAGQVGRPFIVFPELNLTAAVQRSLASRNIPSQNESAAVPCRLRCPFDKVMAGDSVEANAMELVEADCTAVGEMEDIDQPPAGCPQERVFVGAFHLGHDHRGHDPDQDDHYHQLDQRKTGPSRIAPNTQPHNYQFPMSAPSPSPPSAPSAPLDQMSKPVERRVPG